MKPQSRRTFLKTTTALAAALPLSSVPLGAGGGSPPAEAAAVPGGGLFFDPADLPRMRANLATPRFAQLRADLLERDFAADERFLRDEIRLRDHVVDMLRARQILEQTAFAHVLTGDKRQLALARLAIGRLLEYEKWDYFLEGGRHTIGLQRAPEATIAMCCALDWLGDRLEPALRTEMERQIAIKGAPACWRTLYGLKYPDRVQGWTFDPDENFPYAVSMARWPLILNATNLKIIPTAALGIAAVWLHGRHPEAGRWLELARQSAHTFAVMYGADGSYDEGVGYWGYTTMHLVLLAEALRRRLGIDDRRLINYPGTVRFALAMSMPTLGEAYNNPNERKEYNAVPKGTLDPRHDLVNWGDSGNAVDVSVAPWVAREFGDPLAAHVAREVGVIKHWPALAWHQPDAPTAAPGADLHDVRMSNDWIVTRTGWAATDTVVALRSGGPANHEHADRNSLLFKAHGERLFHDPFKAGYSPKGARWLLRLPAAHSLVLIDGQGHQYHDGSEGTNSSWASARVLVWQADGTRTFAVSDAAEAYQLVIPGVEQVLRAFVFLKPDVLIVLDRVRLSGEPRPMQARFQVFNEDGRGAAEAAGASFDIRRPHARLRAVVAGTGAVAAAVRQLPLPAEEGEYPFVEVTSPAALEHVIVTACAASPAGEAPGPLAIAREGDVWRVRGAHRGLTVDVAVRFTADAAELAG